MPRRTAARTAVSVSVLLLIAHALRASGHGRQELAVQEETPKTTLTIIVVDAKTRDSVEGADVFVKSEETDGSFEKTRKTSRRGTVRFTDVPRGKVKVQVTKEGWDTYGERYRMEKEEEQIDILLKKEPPPKEAPS